jgi:hypothetical protein
MNETVTKLGGSSSRTERLPVRVDPLSHLSVQRLVGRLTVFIQDLDPCATIGPPQPPLLAALLDMYREPPDIIERRIKAFIAARPGVAATISRLRHRSDVQLPMPPETLMVLERLHSDRPGLLNRWPTSVPLRELRAIAEAAGRPLAY